MRRLSLAIVLSVAVATSLTLAQGGAPAGRGGATAAVPPADSLRKEWVDPDTGHKLYRLSVENGSEALYFHYNAFSPDKKKVVFHGPSGIWATDLATKKTELIVPIANQRVMEASRVTNEVFYVREGAVWAADLDSKATRRVVALPAGQTVTCANADATLFVGLMTNVPDPDGTAQKPDKIPPTDQVARMFPGRNPDTLTAEQRLSATKESGLAQRLKDAITAPNPRCLFTVNAKTGEVKQFGHAYAWLNHMQFSPIDPNFLMFCHEGTWHEVDRIWTIKVNDPKPVAKLMHKRTMDMEIAGHEGFTPDGKSIYFDLQTPRSVNFWVVTQEVATGKETRYKLDKNEWGIHFHVSNNGKMISSDGSDPGQVAFAPDGAWVNIFNLQAGGTFTREKIVNMKKHNYVTPASGGTNGVEPNVMFTPDDKMVIFRGNFDGALHVYAAEVAKAQ